ncbi:multidrug effflux MFS transporter [Leifsonia sp. A12D58]|uniref:multidrug effflux MFS transporter n=1 Tax=Leifsonia sp. A12D58 TaxID=3397674 RepID=UPI0039E1CD98
MSGAPLVPRGVGAQGIRRRQGASAQATGLILAILAMLTALGPLSVDIYTPSLPLIQHQLGGSEWMVQASITACLLGIGIGQLLWGPLSDRHGRRPVIIVGVIGWTLASVISALSVTPEMLIAARGVAGLCGAAGIVVSRSVVRDLSPDTSSVASRIGILSLVTTIAPVVAPVAGLAIALVWGWRADFVALAAFGGIISLAFALIVPETLQLERRTPPREGGVLGALSTAVRNKELVFVASAIAAHAVGFYAYIATASFVVERQLGYPPAVFALVFGTNAVAMLCANVGFRRIVRTRHPSFAHGIGLTASAVAGGLLVVTSLTHGPEWLLWAASMICAAAAGLVLPGGHSWGQTTLVASGAASALTGSAQFLGGVLGSPLTGIIGLTAAHLGVIVLVSSSIGLGAWWVASQTRQRTRLQSQSSVIIERPR